METRLRCRLLRTWLVVCLGSLAILAGVVYGEEPLPRYQLRVGQELQYRASSSFKYGENSLDHEQDTTVWVVAAHEDGSWRMVAKQVTQLQGTQVTLAHFRLYPDGRLVTNSTSGYQFNPQLPFMRLPENEQQLRDGWKVQTEQDQTYSFAPVAADEENEFQVQVRLTSPMDDIYLSTSTARATFNVARGLVTRVESETTQGYGIEGKGTGTIELVEVRERDDRWLKGFTLQVDEYFESIARYEKLLKESQTAGDKAEQLLREAQEILFAARADATVPEIKSLVEQKIEQHESSVKYYRDSAQRLAQVLNQPAFEFETEDLEGQPHSLKQYRGKVVVLDFWYRGCGWCIRAMPQIKQLAEKYRDRDVVLFGMNTDAKKEDADFVVEKLQLNYPNLKAEGLPEKYQVRAFPTLLIIDQEGVVRDVHVGYSADLAEAVSATIDRLLAGS